MPNASNLAEMPYLSLESLSLPDVYLRLREVMDSGEASMEDVAQVLSLDPALAARVLRIANSAFYGFRSQVDTVSRAAGILGMQKIHDLALAACVSKAVEGLNNPLMDLNTFWYRSVHCGFLAKQIAEGAGMRQAESLFVRGLLHDIGHLVLFSHYPEESRQALACSEQGLEARLAAEREGIGIDAMQLVAELSRIWQLPASFVDTFSHLMQPQQAPSPLAREVAMLNIAVQFSNGVDSDQLVADILGNIRPGIWQVAQLPPDVGSAAMDASTLETADAMYQVLTHQEAT